MQYGEGPRGDRRPEARRSSGSAIAAEALMNNAGSHHWLHPQAAEKLLRRSWNLNGSHVWDKRRTPPQDSRAETGGMSETGQTTWEPNSVHAAPFSHISRVTRFVSWSLAGFFSVPPPP